MGFGSIGVGFGSIGVGVGFRAGGGGNIAVGLGLAGCGAAGDAGEAEGVSELWEGAVAKEALAGCCLLLSWSFWSQKRQPSPKNRIQKTICLVTGGHKSQQSSQNRAGDADGSGSKTKAFAEATARQEAWKTAPLKQKSEDRCQRSVKTSDIIIAQEIVEDLEAALQQFAAIAQDSKK